MTMIRQGDVMLRQIKEMPKMEGLKEVPREDGGVVLAHGEVTGHKHQFREEHVTMYAANDNSGRRFLEVKDAPASLFHEEHTALPVPPGAYEVIQQREWSDDQEPRPVLD